MKISHKEIKLNTKKTTHFIDITDKVKSFVVKTGVRNGLVNIQSRHTTCAVVVNENEPLLLQDAEKFIEELSPQTKEYNHDNFEIRTVNMCDDECANGHAHCKALLMPTNVCLNIIKGELQLGRWQRIFFIELDKSRPRTVQILIVGE